MQRRFHGGAIKSSWSWQKSSWDRPQERIHLPAEPAWGRSPRKVHEQVHLLLEAIPPLSPVLAISTERAAEEEGGDHGLLHCFSLPGVLVRNFYKFVIIILIFNHFVIQS